MKRLLTALVLIPLVLLAVFRLPDQIFVAVVGMVAVLAATEYLQIASNYGFTIFRLTTFVAIGFFYLLLVLQSMNFGVGGPVFLAFLFILLFIFAPSAYLCVGMMVEDLRQVLPGAAVSFFAVPYIAGSLACIGLLREMPNGWFFVLFTFFAVWVGDSAAYYVGRSIGRHKFSPRISPKKTWEGAVASVAGAVIVVAVFSHFAPQLDAALRRAHLLATSFSPLVLTRAPLWVVCVIGAVINAAAQLGDLFESLIKRGAGVKDSGTILPGHGGILDRIDALLFAAPVAFVLFLVLGAKFLAAM